MADSVSINKSSGIDNEESGNVMSKNTNVSTSFIINFENDSNSSSARHKKLVNSSSVFVKRHARSFSLPFTKDWQTTKKCTDTDDSMKPKMCGEENNKNSASYSLHDQIGSGITNFNHTNNVMSRGNENSLLKYCIPNNEIKSVKKSDSSESEGGTYTLDENNKQVLLARRSIDQVFGISSAASHDDLSTDEKLRIKSRLVNEWVEQSIVTSNLIGEVSPLPTFGYCTRNKSYISKIPSPIVKRREKYLENEITSDLNVKTAFQFQNKEFENGLETKPYEQPANSPTNGNIDPEYYLKETESIVTALQNKLRANVKSKPISSMKKESKRQEKEATPNKYPNTRFNKAFSLRRERAKNSNSTTNNTVIPVRTTTISMYATEGFNNETSPIDKKAISGGTSKNKTNFSSTTVTAISRVSNESSRHYEIKKKKSQLLKQNGCRARCNSSLSAQEIEFQNWKRRKNYDPLKAAAEDRKKKSLMHSTTTNSNTVVRNKMRVDQLDENCPKDDQMIMRSASFHGLRSKNVCDRAFYDENNICRSLNNRSSSSAWTCDENFISPDFQKDNRWTVPKPPSTSLQNTPPESISSRLSLLSNAASYSSGAMPSPVAEIDFTKLINIRELSQELKTTLFSIREALRSDYSECSGNFNSTIDNLSSGFNVHHTNKSLAVHFDKSDEVSQIRSNEDNYKKNGIGSDSKLNDLPVDHQLTITWDNLQQIRIAVRDLQLVVPNK